jgi:dTDP-4-dehydrorhamnose reductase
MNKVLVLGANSFLGIHFIDFLAINRIETVGTTRRKSIEPSSEIASFFDLHNIAEFVIPSDISHAVVFSGISGYQNCEEDQTSWKINTSLVPEIICKILANNIKVIFISSSAVFSSESTSSEFDIPHPDSIYGKQKFAAEIEILNFAETNKLRENLSIIRPTKIMCHCKPPFKEWIHGVNLGTCFNALTDLFVAPVSIEYFSNFVFKCIADNSWGLFHLSGADSISYFELAKRFLARKTNSSHLLEKISINELDKPIFYKHKTGKLLMPRATEVMQILPQEISDLLDDIYALK